MLPLVSPSRHSIAKFIYAPSTYARRAIHASPQRRDVIFRNAEGRWSTSVGTIGILTLEMFLILSGLLSIYTLCKIRDVETKRREFEARTRSFLGQGIKERRVAAKLLIAAKACLQEKEAEAKQKGEPFGVTEAFLKAETLRVLKRQEKFLNDFDAGEPVEIAPGYSLRKPR